MSTPLISIVIRNVQEILMRQLTQNERQRIAEDLRQINLKQFATYNPKDVVQILSNLCIEKFTRHIPNRRDTERESFDQHSYNLAQLKHDSDSKTDDPFSYLEKKTETLKLENIEPRDPINTTPAKTYLLLDTKYRIVEEQIGFTKFKWRVSADQNLRSGTINLNYPVRDVIAMRIYQPRIPFLNTYMNVESRRVSILVEEFSAQAFIGSAGRKFHFILRPDIGTTTAINMVELLIEDYNDGFYKFQKPITTFDTMTISFGNPNTLIPFYHDRDTCTFTYGATTTITTTIAHQYAISTYITITGFTTNAPVTDKTTIDAINSLTEQVATYVSGTTFTIAVNTATITPTVGLVANIFFEERRIVIPMELTFLKPN